MSSTFSREIMQVTTHMSPDPPNVDDCSRKEGQVRRKEGREGRKEDREEGRRDEPCRSIPLSSSSKISIDHTILDTERELGRALIIDETTLTNLRSPVSFASTTGTPVIPFRRDRAFALSP